ncbi:MAG: cytochrome c [Proteobacteria bacterium]|nr:cytochrome c [Pseudomonadota bacterium]
MNNFYYIFLLAIIVLPACTDKETEIQKGRQLFQQMHLGQNKVIGCIACHSLKADIKTVGPSLYALGLRADKIVEGLTGEEYIIQSIINPDAYIVSGYAPAIMIADYDRALSSKQIKALAAFLNSLDGS